MRNNILITTSGMLVRELQKDEDDFTTVMLEGREYIIESVGRVPDFVDGPTSHRCINIRDGDEGHIKR